MPISKLAFTTNRYRKLLIVYNFISYYPICLTVKAIDSFLTIFVLVANTTTPLILIAYAITFFIRN